jgi:hypothetical protein
VIGAFLQALAAVGGFGHRGHDASAAVREILAAEGARTYVRCATPLCEGLDLAGYEPAAARDADAGIADVDAAAADTGTVVLEPSPQRPRLVTLLPPVCIFLVPAGVIRPDLAAAIGGRSRWHLVTGPSRSGDIEGELVLGVHGPGRVHAVVLV